MSAVVAGVKAQLQDLLPGQIGTNKQWSDSYIEGVIMLADAAARERCGTFVTTQVISLVANQHTYDLDSALIAIEGVEFSSDGANYDDHLIPATLADNDNVSAAWRDTRSSRPEFYSLLCAVGVPETDTGDSNGSQITIYPALSSVTAETIKVIGTGLGTTTTNVPVDVQSKVYVPFVLAFLFGNKEPARALAHWDEFQRGCDYTKARFGNRYTEDTNNPLR